jgi:preprotein translocase subunit SecD
MRHIGWTLVGIIVVFLAAVYVDLPGTNDFLGRHVAINKGIDIAGGVSVVMIGPPFKDCANGTASGSDMSTARTVIENRVAGGLGTTEPIVAQLGANCIRVELPGATNQQAAVASIGATGYLALTDSASTQLAPGTKVILSCAGGHAAGCPPGSKNIPANLTAHPPVLKVIVPGTDITRGSAQVGFDPNNQPDVTYSMNGSGSTAWCNYTTANVNKFSAIVLDGAVVSDPTIQGAICGGSTQITGLGSTTEAKAISVDLNYGALPVALHVNSSQQVAASLGSQYVNEATTAGIVGLILVALFMILYYRLPGLLADLALVMYTVTVFSLFKLLGVTLTLAGIAGFILSIGMAVDANVLIFERLKEEMRSGKTLGAAIEAGFKRAFPSIRDSNASTLITTVILFWFGHNFAATTITGFATTLFIGVVVSFITAYFVSHSFLRLLVLSGYARNPRLYGVETPEPATPAGGTSVA